MCVCRCILPQRKWQFRLGSSNFGRGIAVKDGFLLLLRHLTCSDGTDSVKLSRINWNGDEADVTIKILLRP